MASVSEEPCKCFLYVYSQLSFQNLHKIKCDFYVKSIELSQIINIQVDTIYHSPIYSTIYNLSIISLQILQDMNMYRFNL